MTASQSTDPARVGKAVRAQTVADVAAVGQLVALAAAVAGGLAHLGYLNPTLQVLAPVGVVSGLIMFIVSLAGGQLADRYREPVDVDEVP